MGQVKTSTHLLDDIEQRIFQTFADIMQEYFDAMHDFNEKKRENKYPKKWITPEIKKRITEIGTENGYEIPKTEFLYDLTWCKYENNKKDEANILLKMDLALESELSVNNDIKQLRDDFNKLLIAYTKYRVFICFEYQYNKIGFPNSVNHLIDELEDSFNKCNNLPAGERLLLLVCSDCGDGKIYPYLMIKS